MRDQTARDPNFPATCARCGGRISEPVAFCPHCGAHARFALAAVGSRARRSPAASSRSEPSTRAYESSDFEGDLDPPWPGAPTPLFASPDGDPYRETRSPGLRNARQWNVKGGTALVLGAFVVIYGSAILLHRYDRTAPPPIPQTGASKSVEGSIGANSTNGANGANGITAPVATNATAPSLSQRNANSGLQAPAPVAGQFAPAPNASDRGGVAGNAAGNNAPMASAPMNNAPTNSTPMTHAAPAPKAGDSTPPDRSIASLPPPQASTAPPVASVQAPVQDRARANDARASSTETTAARKRAEAQAQAQAQVQAQNEAKSGRAATARTLDGVQARLAKNDLKGARASLSRVLASDPHNSYALSLRDQLVSREQARDASLSAARACVVQGRWNCVWHNAGSALSVDASSTEAKALVDRAIIESGAAAAPAGPGPDNVRVPMVQ